MTPIPGPTSSTGSAGIASTVSAICFAIVKSFKKCCPRNFFGFTVRIVSEEFLKFAAKLEKRIENTALYTEISAAFGPRRHHFVVDVPRNGLGDTACGGHQRDELDMDVAFVPLWNIGTGVQVAALAAVAETFKGTRTRAHEY